MNTKDKIASNKTKTEQNNLYLTRKYMGPIYNKARLRLEKKRKKQLS